MQPLDIYDKLGCRIYLAAGLYPVLKSLFAVLIIENLWYDGIAGFGRGSDPPCAGVQGGKALLNNTAVDCLKDKSSQEVSSLTNKVR